MAVTSSSSKAATSSGRARGNPTSVLFAKASRATSSIQKIPTHSPRASAASRPTIDSKGKHAAPLSARDVTAPTPLAPTPVPASLPASPDITDFQRRVYRALLQIPQGKVATYASLAAALGSAPRAVGGALRRNPWAPEVPCHRVVKNDGYIGGFMGDMHAAPSGVNCQRKLQLLAGEGVFFDAKGFMKDKGQVWEEFQGV